MNAQLGSLGVVLGFAASVAAVATLGYGLVKRNRDVLDTARHYSWLVMGGAVVAVVAMERALITRDFTVEFVAMNGSSRTPALFNVATLWAALEGSIILWALVLAGYILALTLKFRDRLRDPLVGWALLTMFAVAVFFFGLMLPRIGAADPFTSFDPPAGYDGPGPNPLLQNHLLMAFHPPMLYLGYVGFTVPFAFAIAALATGRVGEGWLIETRRWTLFAWGFLTIGIILGAWWSYEVLGWGGYWGWDPVENASLLPWLTGTAYLHSVMVQERRGMLRVWNLSLLCATFALTILGTFLTRSGVLESVHAFTESGIGPLVLGFFLVIVLVTLTLIGWRGDRLRAPGRIDSPLSREAGFLANNVVFALFAFVILLGTTFPLMVEAVNDDRLSVGRPFFDVFGQAAAVLLLFLMAVAPVLPWRKTTPSTLAQRLYWPAWVGTASVVVAVLSGARGFTPLLAFGLAGFAAGSALRQLVLATRRQGWRGLVGRANGGMVVHLGVVLIAVGVAASGTYATQRDVRLEEGGSAVVGGHTVRYMGATSEELPEKTVIGARIEIDGGAVYEPRLNIFNASAEQSSGQPIQTPSVRTGPIDDVYLVLLSAPSGDSVSLRVIVQPLVAWLWAGGVLMAVGTVLAAWPGRRRRRPTDPVSAPIAGPTDDERAAQPVGVG
jgi:cytochrome c-type biogenesis protein CcmF